MLTQVTQWSDLPVDNLLPSAFSVTVSPTACGSDKAATELSDSLRRADQERIDRRWNGG